MDGIEDNREDNSGCQGIQKGPGDNEGGYHDKQRQDAQKPQRCSSAIHSLLVVSDSDGRHAARLVEARRSLYRQPL